MNQFKRAQCILLNTQNDNFQFQLSGFNILSKGDGGQRKHLYIISDDEIKEGDWFMLNEEHPQGRLRQCYHISDNNRLWNGENWDTLKGKHYFIQPIGKGSGFVTELECKKIIATTDISLNYIKHDDTVPYPKGEQIRLPQPSQQFIEKYIESYNCGKIITDVLIEYENYHEEFMNPIGKTIINFKKLKVNPKDNTITIKKVKDIWNREEVVILLNKLNNTLNIGSELTLEQWIENNL